MWRYVYRAIDQHGQVIDVLVSTRRDAAAARRFFTRAVRMLKVIPVEVVTDAAPVYPAVLEELVPAAWHHVEQYANNPIEADHGSGAARPLISQRNGAGATPTYIASYKLADVAWAFTEVFGGTHPLVNPGQTPFGAEARS